MLKIGNKQTEANYLYFSFSSCFIKEYVHIFLSVVLLRVLGRTTFCLFPLVLLSMGNFFPLFIS